MLYEYFLIIEIDNCFKHKVNKKGVVQFAQRLLYI